MRRKTKKVVITIPKVHRIPPAKDIGSCHLHLRQAWDVETVRVVPALWKPGKLPNRNPSDDAPDHRKRALAEGKVSDPNTLAAGKGARTRGVRQRVNRAEAQADGLRARTRGVRQRINQTEEQRPKGEWPSASSARGARSMDGATKWLAVCLGTRARASI